LCHQAQNVVEVKEWIAQEQCYNQKDHQHAVDICPDLLLLDVERTGFSKLGCCLVSVSTIIAGFVSCFLAAASSSLKQN